MIPMIVVWFHFCSVYRGKIHLSSVLLFDRSTHCVQVNLNPPKGLSWWLNLMEK